VRICTSNQARTFEHQVHIERSHLKLEELLAPSEFPIKFSEVDRQEKIRRPRRGGSNSGAADQQHQNHTSARPSAHFLYHGGQQQQTSIRTASTGKF